MNETGESLTFIFFIIFLVLKCLNNSLPANMKSRMYSIDVAAITKIMPVVWKESGTFSPGDFGLIRIATDMNPIKNKHEEVSINRHIIFLRYLYFKYA